MVGGPLDQEAGALLNCWVPEAAFTLLLASPYRTQEEGPAEAVLLLASGPAPCGSWGWPPPLPAIKLPTQEFPQDPEIGPAAF